MATELNIRSKAWVEWWNRHRLALQNISVARVDETAAHYVWDAAYRAALETSAQIAIAKGIGNGHMETCAWIADAIREVK